METRNILGFIARVIILTGAATIFFKKGRKEKPSESEEEEIFKKFITNF